MLSTLDLGSMQETLTDSFPERCAIDHVSRVSDGAGGVTGTVPTTPNVPCRFAEVTDKRPGVVAGDELFGDPFWLFTFTAGTDIAVLDLIHVNGRVFEAKTVFNRSWEISLRVFCREVHA